MAAPVHKPYLFSDLVQDEVCAAVWPELLVGGIQVILGNGLAESVQPLAVSDC